jgi:hypothetical protein
MRNWGKEEYRLVVQMLDWIKAAAKAQEVAVKGREEAAAMVTRAAVVVVSVAEKAKGRKGKAKRLLREKREEAKARETAEVRE